MRIARALALAGIASRRASEEHIRNGAVSVNGEVIRDLGRQVNPEQDEIFFRGKPLNFQRYVYYLLYKPKGYVTTSGDPHASKTVYDLLPRSLVRGTHQPSAKRIRVFSVGRLDRDTSGVLLFTNDGDLAHRLTHPSFQIGKWYEARLDRPFVAEDIRRLLSGIQLEDGVAKVQKIYRFSKRVVRILICEGKKREVRRLFSALNYHVVDLTRIAFGPLTLEGLKLGMGRFLAKSEILKLKKTVSHLANPAAS